MSTSSRQREHAAGGADLDHVGAVLDREAHGVAEPVGPAGDAVRDARSRARTAGTGSRSGRSGRRARRASCAATSMRGPGTTPASIALRRPDVDEVAGAHVAHGGEARQRACAARARWRGCACSGTPRRRPSTTSWYQLSPDSPVRCMCASMMPGSSVASPRSITVAPAGTARPVPTALIAPPSTTTTPFGHSRVLRAVEQARGLQDRHGGRRLLRGRGEREREAATAPRASGRSSRWTSCEKRGLCYTVICSACSAENDASAAACFTCKAPFASLGRGDVLAGRYEIRAFLGRGGMGAVYRAHDRTLDEDVALKVLRAGLLGTPDGQARFLSEIKLARRVSHPGVCRHPRIRRGRAAGASSRWSSWRAARCARSSARRGAARPPSERARRSRPRSADGAGGDPRGRHRPSRPEVAQHHGRRARPRR